MVFLFVNWVLFIKNGGILSCIFDGIWLWILKFLLVRIRFFGIRFFKKCECLIMLVFDIDLGYNGEIYIYKLLGVIVVSVFIVCWFL